MVVHFFYMLKGIFRRFAIYGCKDSANSVLYSGTGKLFKVKWGRFSDIMLSAQPFGGYFTMAWHFSEPFYAAVLITILCCVSCLHYPVLQLYCHCT